MHHKSIRLDFWMFHRGTELCTSSWYYRSSYSLRILDIKYQDLLYKEYIQDCIFYRCGSICQHRSLLSTLLRLLGVQHIILSRYLKRRLDANSNCLGMTDIEIRRLLLPPVYMLDTKADTDRIDFNQSFSRSPVPLKIKENYYLKKKNFFFFYLFKKILCLF